MATNDKVVPPYYDDRIYIDALKKHIKNEKKKKRKFNKIICSFHGIPKNIFLKAIHIIVNVQKQ